jgi:hypothetical protein
MGDGGIAEPCGWWGVLPRQVGCSVWGRCSEGFGVGGGFPGLSAEGGASCRCATQPRGGWATHGDPPVGTQADGFCLPMSCGIGTARSRHSCGALDSRWRADFRGLPLVDPGHAPVVGHAPIAGHAPVRQTWPRIEILLVNSFPPVAEAPPTPFVLFYRVGTCPPLHPPPILSPPRDRPARPPTWLPRVKTRRRVTPRPLALRSPPSGCRRGLAWRRIRRSAS